MFSLFTEKLRHEVETIKSILDIHDEIRSRLYTSPVAAPLDGLRAIVPPLPEWRIYDHCAAFTRLYALYENFISDLVSEWLKMLPQLYPEYKDLPVAVRTGHRMGVAEILQKLGGDRYGYLSEEKVLRGISDGAVSQSSYALLPDAFIIDSQNLRQETLTALLVRCGLSEPWKWICSHGMIVKYIEEVRGNSSTVESELRSFITLRNEAAHGEIDQLVATEEIKKVADFVILLCHAVAELIMSHAVKQKLHLGQATLIGVVIHQFSENIVGIEMQPGSIVIGEELIICRDQACYKAQVQSIEVEKVRHKSLEASINMNVGLQLTTSAKVDSKVYRLRSPS